MQALCGCRNARIPVPKEVMDKAIKYIQKCTVPDGGVQYSLKTGGGGRPPIAAAAIAPVQRRRVDSEYAPKMMKYCDRYFQNVGTDNDGHWHMRITITHRSCTARGTRSGRTTARSFITPG